MTKRATRHEEESWRGWFFVVSILFLASMVWLLADEFVIRRPWKRIQLDGLEVERMRANRALSDEEQALLATSPMAVGASATVAAGRGIDRVGDLDRAIERFAVELSDGSTRATYEGLRRDLASLERDVADAAARLSRAKSEEDAAYSRFRSARSERNERAVEKARRDEARSRERVAALGAEYDALALRRDDVSMRIAAMEKRRDAARKERDAVVSRMRAAERAIESIDTLRARLLPPVDVRQLWNPDLDLADRCPTCHVGFDKCGFSRPQEILEIAIDGALPPDALRKRYCLTRDEADAYADAATRVVDSWYEDAKIDPATLIPEIVTEKSDAGPVRHRDPVIAAAIERFGVEAKDATAIRRVERLYRTHPRADVLLAKHPADTFGCTTCHYGQGRQLKGVGLNWLAAWASGDPRHLAPFDHGRSDPHWRQPMLDSERGHTEASCFNCHADDYELEFAPRLTRGRKLAEQLGCVGCHPLGVLDGEHKRGPSLVRVREKIRLPWLADWLRNPAKLRPGTSMPNFWPRASGESEGAASVCNAFDWERGSPHSPAVPIDCREQREEEVAFIVAYLDRTSTRAGFEPTPEWADAEHGRRIFEKVGCRGCHNMQAWRDASRLPGSDRRDYAPDLTGIGAKIESTGWLARWVDNPKLHSPDTRMPRLRLGNEEAWHVAKYLASERGDEPRGIDETMRGRLDAEDSSEKGRMLIRWYGCSGCHDIPGFEKATRIGADLTSIGSKTVEQFDFGDVPEFVEEPSRATWENWIRTKLRTPRIFDYERVTTRMPAFDLSSRELDDLVVFLMSQNDVDAHYPDSIRRASTPRDRAIARGERLVDRYNCLGCHSIDGDGLDVDGDHRIDGGAIARLFVGTPDAHRAPPRLVGEGAKVIPTWLFGFLRAPFELRKNLEIRMPTFDFSEGEANDFVAYFAAKARAPYPFVAANRIRLGDADRALAERLFSEAQCLGCHDPSAGSREPRNIAPSLRHATERLRSDWLFEWLRDPQAKEPGSSMPSFFAPVDGALGKWETPLVDLAGGDAIRQIELLRAYVLELGEETTGAASSAMARVPRPAARAR